MTDLLAGVVVADKPRGPTSHDAVALLRRTLKGIRVGHGGTLDPMATGVLPLLVGSATRLLRYLPSDPKVYVACAQLGVETDTGDAEGRPLSEARPVQVDDVAIRGALEALLGPQMQTPPMYSAKKVAGRRLYRSARAGLEVERIPSAVTIHRLELLRREDVRVWFEVSCSPGTYVRAMVTDLGQSLGTGATLVELRRTASGPFTLERAAAWSELADPDAIGRLVRPLDELPLSLPTLPLPAAELDAFRSGRAVTLPTHAATGDSGTAQVRTPAGRLVGICEWQRDDDQLRLQPRMVLPT